MAALPYFPMYPTDFEAKAGYLTLEEDGAYNRLLRIMWMTPGCSVPDDPAWIARRMKVDSDTYQRVVSPIIDEFMDCRNQRVFNSRLSEEYAKAKKRWVSAKNNGRKGGRPPKALKDNDKDKSNGLQSANRNESYLEPEPELDKDISESKDSSYGNGISKPSKPKPKSGYSEQFENDFWKPYPRTPTMSKQETWKQWKKLPAEDRALASNAVPAFIDYCKANPDYPVVHACRFLSQRRFDGFAEEVVVVSERQHEADKRIMEMWGETPERSQ